MLEFGRIDLEHSMKPIPRQLRLVDLNQPQSHMIRSGLFNADWTPHFAVVNRSLSHHFQCYKLSKRNNSTTKA